MEKNKKRLIETLIRGQDSAKKLHKLVPRRENDDGSDSVYSLVMEILVSFSGGLSLLDFSDSDKFSVVPVSPPHAGLACSGDQMPKVHSGKKPAQVVKERRGCYKTRKTIETRVKIHDTIEDGCAWRKYGQKEIPTSKFPRYYYRCTHKIDHGCKAQKQVQKLEDGTNRFHITYFGHHACPFHFVPVIFLVEEFIHLKIQLHDITSATDNFGPNKLIGRGGFGNVYKGELFVLGRSCMVAFKRLDSKLGQGNTEFWKEISMLSKYKHENLVSLLHFCFEGDERILVYEHASRGSLDRYLSDASLTWIQRLKICVGAARGLNYLHDPMKTERRVLHRDIKSSNILLNEEWNAKISDFGLSKVGPANQSHTYLVSNIVGTIGYCDPLYFETGLLSKESDVYSFGVVLFEVMCGRLCCECVNGQKEICILVPRWKKCFEEDRLDDIVFHGLKKQIQQDSLMTFSTIASRCLQRDHRKRPTMVEVVQQLNLAIEQQLGISANEETDKMKHIGD